MYPSHIYRDRRGVDLIFHPLPFGALRYIKPGHAVSYANLSIVCPCFCTAYRSAFSTAIVEAQ